MSLLDRIISLEAYDKLVEEFAQGKRRYVQPCSRCSSLAEQYQRDFPTWTPSPAVTYVVQGRRYTMGLCKTCGEIEEADRKNRRAAQELPPAANSPNRFPRQDPRAPPGLVLGPRPLPPPAPRAPDDFKTWHESTGDR